MLSEQKLSNRLRIEIIEQVAEIDLPWFLFLEIDAALTMLNYFKLSNLQRNLKEYLKYLKELAHEYNDTIQELSNNPTFHRYTQWETAWFLTDHLISKGVHIKAPQQKLITIESLYRVKCLLRMKEFINRRIYNEQRGKGVIQKRLKERLEGKKKKEK